MIACDTSALSQFLRRSSSGSNEIARNVEILIEANELALFGIVRQEILSGIKLPEHFERIEQATQALPIFSLTTKITQPPPSFSMFADQRAFKVHRSIF